jgi:hypothetical protein
MMGSGTTNKTTTGAEEQVHIINRQMRKGVKHEAVHSYGYGSGED